MKRQKQILFVLLIVLALALIYSWWSSPRQVAVSSDYFSRDADDAKSSTDKARSAVDLQKVNLELLEVSKKKYRGYKRDIFNYYTPKPKIAPKPVVKVDPKPVPKPPKPVITHQVRKQLARFTFLGFLQKDESRTVFLSKRDELFLVKEADSFGEENQFEVVEITEESMAIKQNGTSGLIEIVLKEEEPLIPSFSSDDEDNGSTVNRKVEGNTPLALPGGGVPSAERRRKWFKDTQPSPTE